MKFGKKVLSFALAAAISIGMTACGSGAAEESASGTKSGSADKKYDKVVYAYATFNNIPAEKDLDEVEEAINKITRDKINVEVTLKPISIAEYSSKVSLALQGGEKIDIFQSLGDFNTCVSQDMAYDISDLIKNEGKEKKLEV